MTVEAYNRVLIDLRYDAIESGMTFGPVELTVTDQLLKSFAFAIDDYGPILENNGTGHAAILVPELLELLNSQFDPSTSVGLHQKEEVWLHSPVRVGEPVVMEGRCVDKYAKRGKGYFVMEASARSLEDDRPLVRHRSTEIAEIDPELPSTVAESQQTQRQVTGTVAPGLVPVAHADTSLEVGTPVVPLTKSVHQDQMSVFSNVGLFWRSMHTDLERAKQAGYKRTVAQGLMQTMYVSELGTRLFGESWLTSGWMSTTYLKPAFAGDTLTVNAAVAGISTEAGQTQLELEVWVENEDGLRTSVGWLRASV
jgi:acyl dehydratase